MIEDMLPEIKQFMIDHKQNISLREYKYFECLINEIENNCCCNCHPSGDTWVED